MFDIRCRFRTVAFVLLSSIAISSAPTLRAQAADAVQAQAVSVVAKELPDFSYLKDYPNFKSLIAPEYKAALNDPVFQQSLRSVIGDRYYNLIFNIWSHKSATKGLTTTDMVWVEGQEGKIAYVDAGPGEDLAKNYMIVFVDVRAPAQRVKNPLQICLEDNGRVLWFPQVNRKDGLKNTAPKACAGKISPQTLWGGFAIK